MSTGFPFSQKGTFQLNDLFGKFKVLYYFVSYPTYVSVILNIFKSFHFSQLRYVLLKCLIRPTCALPLLLSSDCRTEHSFPVTNVDDLIVEV